MSAPGLTDDTSPRRRGPALMWAAAALGAVVIHAAGAGVAFQYMRTAEPDEALGAPAIEIGVELAAPRLEPTDLPPGPDTDASAASPPVVAQKEVIKESELPKATPTETEDPDRVVAPDSPKKPTEADPEIAAPPMVPSPDSAASEATAVPRVDEVPEAPRSVTPAQGIGASAQRIKATWQKELAAHLHKHKRYPTDRSSRDADLIVSFELDRTGHVLAAHVVKGSGDAAFDEAALAMMRRADPVPAPPPLVADDGLSFTLPVIFRVKKHK
jgi:TonB family protein